MEIPRVVLVEQPGQRGYLPIAGAYLIAYAKSDPDLAASFVFDLINDPLTVSTADICDRIFAGGPPILVGVSCQGWSFYSAETIAREVKERSPKTLVILGGNHVTNQGASILESCLFVDAVINGEGEVTFREILRHLRSAGADPKRLAEIDGVSARDADGSYLPGRPRARIVDLNDLPSPYLDRVIDPNAAGISTVLLETNRGCPYQCSFCYWGGAINTKVRQFSLERLKAEMEMLSQSGVSTWYICDANFGILKRDEEVVQEIIRLHRKNGNPKVFYTNWAKQSNERIVNIIATLNCNGIQSTFTIAAQSTDSATLELAKRKNMNINKISELASLCRKYGVIPRGELIWGLPGESFDRFLKSYDDISEHTVATVVHPHCILPNTGYKEQIEELGIVTRRGDMDTAYEYCVEHNQMPYEDFLKGMRFILSNSILQTAGTVFVVYPIVAQKVAHIPYSTIINRFAGWCAASDSEIAEIYQMYFRFPLSTHKHVLEQTWRLVKTRRDEFLGMVTDYLEGTFHDGLSEEQASILREAFEYDKALYPIVDDQQKEAWTNDTHYLRTVWFSHDFRALHATTDDRLREGSFAYEVRYRKGLWRTKEEELYYGLMSFRGTVERTLERERRPEQSVLHDNAFVATGP